MIRESACESDTGSHRGSGQSGQELAAASDFPHRRQTTEQPPCDDDEEQAKSEALTNDPYVNPSSDGSGGRRKHRRSKRGSYNQVNAVLEKS